MRSGRRFTSWKLILRNEKTNKDDDDDDGFSVYFTFNMILLSITLTALRRQVNGSSLEQIAERSENGYFPNV